MKWSLNQYHPFSQASEQALLLSRSLMQSYPFTQGSLEILGDKLLKQLEFGFFENGTEIITQGGTGMDVFLLCAGDVDVLVDDFSVVTMTAPVLFGEKAIVESKSKRAATIKVCSSNPALFIKIPMEKFIKDPENKNIPDRDFKQDTIIYHSIFEGIQKRLFDYSYLQKNLWSQANTRLNLINAYFLAKKIETKSEESWTQIIWMAICEYLASVYQFSWPNKLKMNISNLRKVILNLIEKKQLPIAISRDKRKVAAMRNLLWRNTLNELARLILKMIPQKNHPVVIDNIELFNPRIYCLRLGKKLSLFEKDFQVKANSSQQERSISDFFGKKDNSNAFDLESYIDYFMKRYQLKESYKTLSFISRQAADVAAKTENQFNKSVIQIQNFLEKTKESYSDDSNIADETLNMAELKELIEVIQSSLFDFDFSNVSHHSILGKIQFNKNFSPKLTDLIKHTSLADKRANIDRSFNKLSNHINLREDILKTFQAKQLPYFCSGYPGDIINDWELSKNYWISLSENIELFHGNSKIMDIIPGMLIGGRGWYQKPLDGNKTKGLYLRVKSQDKPLFMVIPINEFSWEWQDNPDRLHFLAEFIPQMRWLVNKFVRHLTLIVNLIDEQKEKLREIEQTVSFSNKIKDFESGKHELSPAQKKKAAKMLKNTLGLGLNIKEKIYSSRLSRQIYNYIVRQMGEEDPNMPLETRGNRAYTKSRFVLSDVIEAIEENNLEVNYTEERPVFELISNELELILKPFMREDEEWSSYVQRIDGKFSFNPADYFRPRLDQDTEKMIVSFKEIQQIFEKYLMLVLKEYLDITQKLNATDQTEDDSSAEILKRRMIEEYAIMLSKCLEEQK